MTDESGKYAVEKAKSVLRANLGADFEELAPHLRSLLENLPILKVDAPALQAYPVSKSTQSILESAMEFLRRGWIATKASEYETIGASSIAEEAELLSVTFDGNIWSVGHMQRRLIVARIGDDVYRCWRYDASGGVWGSAPGHYEVPRLDPVASELRSPVPDVGKKAPHASLLELFTHVREWLGRRVRRMKHPFP